MIFNSFSFLVFFASVFFIYSLLSHRWQNKLLLISSYIFYAAWDYRFCLLLFTTTLVDYSTGLYISRYQKYRKEFLVISVCINLTILGFFKYFNFFTESFSSLLLFFGLEANPLTLNIILPVGISFYTFQSMSYVFDIYRNKIKPVTYLSDYALYVSFFPQLVAGPIERATHLLPQILKPRTISFITIQNGCYFIICGIFLKIFVADNIARMIDPIFNSNTPQTGLQYLLAGYGFTFQIYGDFAGYSYVAKGLGAILGFDIMDNFNLPYFSQNPQEFWRRWHISLSTWLRDYLYIPLGGNRGGPSKTIRNLIITMLLGGLWHGAKMTFVLWGGIHGLFLIIYHVIGHFKSNFINNEDLLLNRYVIKCFKILFFFHLIVFTWYIFRVDSLSQITTIFQAMICNFHPQGEVELASKLAFYILPLLFFQLLQFISKDLLILFRLPIILRAVSYVVIFYLIVIFGVNHAQDYIYFQF